MENDIIPAVFVVAEGGSLCAGPVSFRNGTIHVEPQEKVSTIRELRGGKVRAKTLMIDAESLNTGGFNAPVVSRSAITGTDVWLVECISDLADVADAFLGGMSKIVFPVHRLRSPSVLDGIAEASDACIPMLMFAEGRGLTGNDAVQDAARIRSAGFSNTVLFDTDGTVPPETLSGVQRIIPGLGVLSPSSPSPFGGVRFGHHFGYTVRGRHATPHPGRDRRHIPGRFPGIRHGRPTASPIPATPTSAR